MRFLDNAWTSFGYYLTTKQKWFYTGLFAFVAFIAMVFLDTLVGALAILTGVYFVWNKNESFTEHEKKWFVTIVATAALFSVMKLWGAIILTSIYVAILIVVWGTDFLKGYRATGVRGGFKRIISGGFRPKSMSGKRKAAKFMGVTLVLQYIVPLMILIVAAAGVAQARATEDGGGVVKKCQGTWGANVVCRETVNIVGWVTQEVKEAKNGDTNPSHGVVYEERTYPCPYADYKEMSKAKCTKIRKEKQGEKEEKERPRISFNPLSLLKGKDTSSGRSTLSLPKGLEDAANADANAEAEVKVDADPSKAADAEEEKPDVKLEDLRGATTNGAGAGSLLSGDSVRKSSSNRGSKSYVAPEVSLDRLTMNDGVATIIASASDENKDLKSIDIVVKLSGIVVAKKSQTARGSAYDITFDTPKLPAGDYEVTVGAKDRRGKVDVETTEFTVTAAGTIGNEDGSLRIDIVDFNVTPGSGVAGVTDFVFAAKASHTDDAPTTPIKYVFEYGDGATFTTYGANGEPVTAKWRFGVANETKSYLPEVTASYKTVSTSDDLPALTVNGNVNGTGPAGDSGDSAARKAKETAEQAAKSWLPYILWGGAGLAVLVAGYVMMRKSGKLDGTILAPKPKSPYDFVAPKKGFFKKLGGLKDSLKKTLKRKESDPADAWAERMGLQPGGPPVVNINVARKDEDVFGGAARGRRRGR